MAGPLIGWLITQIWMLAYTGALSTTTTRRISADRLGAGTELRRSYPKPVIEIFLEEKLAKKQDSGCVVSRESRRIVLGLYVIEPLGTLFHEEFPYHLRASIEHTICCRMLCQSASLMFFRIMSRRFYLFKLNELGLVQVDCSNLCSIGYLIYSVLLSLSNLVTLVDMISKQLSAGRYQTWQIFLFGTKFIVALDASWGFLWVVVCHCATLKWRSPTSQTEFGKTIIPRSVPWALHAAVLGARLWPATIQEYSRMDDIVRPVIEALLNSALTYSPDTYSASKLWMILLPSIHALPHLAYIPCLMILLRGMYNGPAKPAMKRDEELGASSQTLQRSMSQMNESITPQRDATVLHALVFYTSILVHLPVLIWASVVGGHSASGSDFHFLA
ncbi:uncharacterized protein MELLADRAFT_101729 [Melampsora larici-populina 98AG31]|uniref:Uncharacterized protein n=1 Tax=Melampsora larici-populina (strain 98AG31 / pathotype 3-4-7) TaxID=747676 RepID=F4R6S4_MELLP|nr:uncharacterized protein MELLADRAFT_101729 [Melampsora larici-populina 98AG31]EGG12408.1 hypothetical protein MELLADRAFT_101729 [Melampsora larici-populina 98AG31]